VSAPVVTRTPDGTILLETVGIDAWSALVTVLTDDTVLRVHVMRACRSGDGRLKAYAAWRLYEACATAMQTVLTDTECAELAEQLDNAQQQPEPCFYCQEPAASELSGMPVCAAHLKAYGDAEEVPS
jgi:hypothetical protein